MLEPPPSGRRRSSVFVALALVTAGAVAGHANLARLVTAGAGPLAAEALLVVALVAAGLGSLAAAWARPSRPSTGHHAASGAFAASTAGLATAVAGIEAVAASHAKPDAAPSLAALPLPHAAALVALTALASGAAAFALARLVGAVSGRNAASDVGARAGRGLATALVTVGLGAAGGCVLSAVTLRHGAPRSPLVAALVLAIGAALAAVVVPKREPAPAPAPGPDPDPDPDPDHEPHDGRAHAPWPWVATVLFGSVTLVAGDVGAPYLKPRVQRLGALDRVTYSAWSELGNFAVERPSGSVRWLRVDGARYASLHDATSTPTPSPEDVAFARLNELGAKKPRVAVLQAAGGRHVRVALKSFDAEVTAFVLEGPLARDVLLGEGKSSGSDWVSSPRVRLELGDGRAALAREPGAYAAIVLAPETSHERGLAVRPARDALALAADAAFSREAVATYLGALAPTGALVLRHAQAGLAELEAVASLALRARGAADPAAHLFACSDRAGGVALVVGARALDTAALRAYRRVCSQHRFEEVGVGAIPGAAPPEPATPATPATPTEPAATHVEPVLRAPGRTVDFALAPTDDRPTFAAARGFAGLKATLAVPALAAAPRDASAADANTGRRRPPAVAIAEARFFRAALVVTLVATLVATALAFALTLRAGREPRRRERALDAPGALVAREITSTDARFVGRGVGRDVVTGLAFALLGPALVRVAAAASGSARAPVVALPLVFVGMGFGALASAWFRGRDAGNKGYWAFRAAHALAIAPAVAIGLAGGVALAMAGASSSVPLAMVVLVATIASAAALGATLHGNLAAAARRGEPSLAARAGVVAMATAVGACASPLVAAHFGYSTLLALGALLTLAGAPSLASWNRVLRDARRGGRETVEPEAVHADADAERPSLLAEVEAAIGSGSAHEPAELAKPVESLESPESPEPQRPPA